jgi:hypothetical protein
MILLRDYRVKVYRRLVVPAAAGQDSIHGRLMPPIPNPIARLWQRQTYSLFSLFPPIVRSWAPPSLSTTSRSRNSNKKIPYMNRRRQNGIIVVVGLVRNLWPPPQLLDFDNLQPHPPKCPVLRRMNSVAQIPLFLWNIRTHTIDCVWWHCHGDRLLEIVRR